MATISGLQSPNPYAQPVSRAKPESLRSSETAPPTAVPTHHAAYSPDWMQAEHPTAQSGEADTLYSAKGQLQKLPTPAAAASQPVEQGEVVADQVTLSSDAVANPTTLPESGKP